MKKIITIFFLFFCGCTTDYSQYRDLLKEHTLVMEKDGVVTTFDQRGINPLLKQLEQGTFEGAFLADRIVGKAAALLYVYGKVKKVYTLTISKPAIQVFEEYGIKYTADQVIENIRNREKTGLCPMETKVLFISDPTEAYKVLSSH
ncbi:MAG: DUF1893 domain-containing protein [Alphaproteobacteria bacterium]|nr:DUF1893 domain-containing protein [Alphaproteobacteria bacterium]